MSLEYEQPRSITFKQKEYIKDNFLELIKRSKIEFDTWKRSHNEIFLRQAGEKIFNAIEHFVELKKNISIVYHTQFKHEFRTIKGINKNTIETLILKADSLHRFFYDGELYERDIKLIESKYLDVYNYLQNNIKRL